MTDRSNVALSELHY